MIRRLSPLAAFVTGFLLAVLPAAFVTRVVATQLPLTAAVLHGRTATAFAAFLALCAGLATAVVGMAARDRS